MRQIVVRQAAEPEQYPNRRFASNLKIHARREQGGRSKMRQSTKLRIRATKLRFRAFHFSHALVLVLCYCIAVQPNAALAARSAQLVAAAPAEKSSSQTN